MEKNSQGVDFRVKLDVYSKSVGIITIGDHITNQSTSKSQRKEDGELGNHLKSGSKRGRSI